MSTFAQYLKEKPQYYPGRIVYQKDSKFIKISRNNLSRYEVLGDVGGFLFLVDPSNSAGYVFDDADVRGTSHAITPVMHLSLRDSGFNNLRQAYKLRIKSTYSQQNIATTWYKLYVKNKGGIVSDTEHLEGGKTLWKSFLSHPGEGYQVSIVNLDTKQEMPITTTADIDQLEKDIWSKDKSKRNIVLVLSTN